MYLYRHTFGGTALTPSIILVTPTSTRTITMALSMTTTTRAASFANRLGTRFFGLCDLCSIAWKRAFIRSVIWGVTIEKSYSKCIRPVTLRNIPFIHQIEGMEHVVCLTAKFDNCFKCFFAILLPSDGLHLADFIGSI